MHQDRKLSGSSSPYSVSVNSTSTDSVAALNGKPRDKNIQDLLKSLPSSPKDLLLRIEKQRDEIRLLQEENIRLKSKEMEVSNLTLRLQQQFSATQTQVDNIKLHIQQQLGNPITEEEYTQLDALPENKRDLLDTIKIGIFRQMGSLRASHQSATKRCAEMSAAVARLEGENRDHLLHIEELKKQVETLNDKFSDKLGGADKQYQRILELEAQNKELEGKLRTFFLSQEDFLKARLTAQVKTDEVARLAVRLEQAELDVERFKAVAECTEQKLDILKSEYYEMKLAHQQRQLELEAALKAADQKLKHVGDLELESELFLSNYSREAGETGGSELLNAFPQSRKMAHAVSVTKKCLHLENKAALLEQDLKARDTQILRLKSSLEAAREALHNSNSPYALIEKTMNDISAENELLKERNEALLKDNKLLSEKLRERNSDMEVLCKHRSELVRIKRMLVKLGVNDGALPEDTAAVETPSGQPLFSSTPVQQKSITSHTPYHVIELTS